MYDLTFMGTWSIGNRTKYIKKNWLKRWSNRTIYEKQFRSESNKQISKSLTGDLLQLAAVSTFRKPISQLNKSMFFEDNFKPFLLETNKRAIADPLYSDFQPSVE